jgi:hypothetical protein
MPAPTPEDKTAAIWEIRGTRLESEVIDPISETCMDQILSLVEQANGEKVVDNEENEVIIELTPDETNATLTWVDKSQ